MICLRAVLKLGSIIKEYKVSFVLLLALFLTVYVLFPVFTVMGNDLLFQIQTYNAIDFVMLVLLSASTSALLLVSYYSQINRKKVCSSVEVGGSAIFGSLSGVLASIVATATCAGCVAPIVALFGLGFGVLTFLLQYQLYVGIGAIILQFLFVCYLLRKQV